MLSDKDWESVEEQVVCSAEVGKLDSINPESALCYRHGDYAPCSVTDITFHRCTAPGCKSTWRERRATFFDDDIWPGHRISYLVCEGCRGIHIFEQSAEVVRCDLGKQILEAAKPYFGECQVFDYGTPEDRYALFSEGQTIAMTRSDTLEEMRERVREIPANVSPMRQPICWNNGWEPIRVPFDHAEWLRMFPPVVANQ